MEGFRKHGPGYSGWARRGPGVLWPYRAACADCGAWLEEARKVALAFVDPTRSGSCVRGLVVGRYLEHGQDRGDGLDDRWNCAGCAAYDDVAQGQSCAAGSRRRGRRLYRLYAEIRDDR